MTMDIRLGIINGIVRRRSGWIRVGWSWGVRWQPEGDDLMFSERVGRSTRTALGYRFRLLEPLSASHAAMQRRA